MTTATRPKAPRAGKELVAYAKSLQGHPYGVGWCQKFTNETFGTGAVGDWDGDGAADAEDGWKKAKSRGVVVTAEQVNGHYDKIPAAVMLFWTGGSHGNGHAAIGIGGGKMVSTDLPTQGKIGIVDIETAHNSWGLTFAGYATVDGNGYDLGSYTPASAAPPKHAQSAPKYAPIHVTAGPNRGRTYPGIGPVSVYWINDRRQHTKVFSRHIFYLQRWLNKVGIHVAVTGYWNAETQRGYDRFRKSVGYNGKAATGAVGLQSLTKLRDKAKAAKQVKEGK